MKRILVTGGTGRLGGLLVGQLQATGYRVRGLSREPVAAAGPVEWVQADFITGDGLDEAVAGVDSIIHTATMPGRQSKEVDVAGTSRLIAAARAAGVGHLVYVSIVGIEQIPTAYYRNKLAAEALVAASGLPWSIQRATQFHHFLDQQLRGLVWLPIMPLPTDFLWQPMEPEVLAQRLVAVVGTGPGGRQPDIGGPEVLRTRELARLWLDSQALRKAVLHLPLPGAAARGLRNGANTCPTQRGGGRTWAEWLEARYTRAAQQATCSEAPS